MSVITTWYYFFTGTTGPHPIVTNGTLPDGRVGVVYSATLTSTGGTGSITWSVIGGSLPTGLTLNTSTGAITGTPTVIGSFTFSVQAKDSLNATGAATFTVGVMGISINGSLSSAVINSPYNSTFVATGGTAPYTWSLDSGAFPDGIELLSTGIIFGVPTVFGTFIFTIRVEDVDGNIGLQTFNFVVANVRLHGVIEMELNGKGNGWTVNNDVMMNAGVVSHRGLPGTRVLDRVADISTLRFTLDNSQFNSASKLGYYAPDNVNVRVGFNVNIGIRYRFGNIVRFTGTLDEINVIPGTNGPRTVSCVALGWFDIAQRETLSNLPILQNSRGDEVFQTLISSLSPISQPLAIEKDFSTNTYPYTLDKTRDEQTKLRDELYRLCLNGLDLCWERGDGTLVYESRSRRAAIASDVDTFTDSHGFLASRNRSSVLNSVQATIHPRNPGTVDVVMYSLDSITPLIPNQPITILGPWTDPANPDKRTGAISLLPLEKGVDYKVLSESDADITDSVTIVTGLSGNATSFTITLAGSLAGRLTVLKQRGKPLYDYGTSILSWKDDTSIQQFGVKPQALDMSYQADANFAQEVAQYLVYTGKDPNTQIASPFTRFCDLNDTIDTLRSLNRDISDRIRLRDIVSGVSRSFFINSIDETEFETTLKTQWNLVFADSTAFWLLEVIGRGELNINTRLGFGLILGHTDVIHGDAHIDNAHADIEHVDTHVDQPHEDAAHGDGPVHGDSVHTDSAHADSVHADSAHADATHVDSPHQDVRFQNSHSDIPHSDVPHGDSTHVDVPHDDVTSHSDADQFGDDGLNPIFVHTDLYQHTDVVHEDLPHGDVHNDTAHADVHNDVSFQDEAHEDIGHADALHVDVIHGDTEHTDIPHADAEDHADSPELNTPHGDEAHQDLTHTDVPHGDVHNDLAHGDVN